MVGTTIKGSAGNISRTVTTSRQIQFALKITFEAKGKRSRGGRTKQTQ